MSAAIKPEIYISWMPKGNIVIKPEIYATVYRAPQITRITGKTHRIISKTESVEGDLKRQIGNVLEVAGNLTRQISKSEIAGGDTARAIKIPQVSYHDALRKIEFAASINGDTNRNVKATQIVSGDTQRKVFIFEPEVVKISGAMIRKIATAVKVAADTLSRNGISYAVNGDSRRKVNVNSKIAGGTARKIFNMAHVAGDTKIQVSHSDRISGDAFRKVGKIFSVQADLLIKVHKYINTFGDTRLIQGLAQGILADTYRKLNYAIWKVLADTPENPSNDIVFQQERPRGNHIKIGEVNTMSVENWRTITDDRQELIKTIGGVIVQDFGHISEGDNFSCIVTLRAEAAFVLYRYWHNRTRVNVIDEAGNVHENMRVVVKEYSYIPHFCNYFTINLEFWRV